MKNWIIGLTLVAALTPTPADAQRAHATGREWRTKVLGAEGRLHDDPNRDFAATIGPQYICRNGWWYTADMHRVYFEGRWVEAFTLAQRITVQRTLVVKRAPEGD